MKKSSFYFSVACLVLGAIFALGATVLLVMQCLKAWAIISIVLYLLILSGGAFLALFAWKSLLLQKQTQEPVDSLPVKSRSEASEHLAQMCSYKKALFSKSVSTLILTVAACIFLGFYTVAQDVPLAPKSTALENFSYETAEVLEITSEEYQGSQIWEDRPVGEQILRIKLTSGEREGTKFKNVINNLSIHNGTVLKEGDSIIVAISDDGETIEFQGVYDYNRFAPLAVIVLLFILATVLVGGKVGAKSLLGLSLTILCVFTILFPLLIGGWPTLPTVLGMCAFVTVVEFVIIGGVNKKILCAILGTISGVAIAMLFGEFATAILRLSSYQLQDSIGEVEALAQLRNLPMREVEDAVRVENLLVGGILIAALGAVNDVAMSISSSMNELVAVNPNLTRKELFKSGMNIGRDMVGTMTNTLILALVGGSFIEILYYSTQDLSFNELMSKPYFTVEIMQGVASSIGVILAVPLSVVLGVVFFAKWPGKKQTKKK